ncbi:hypothetical protein BDW69DRAFT_77276 [Aspergillus filifer]
MSFTEFQNLLPGQVFSKDLIQRGTQLILIALIFMHQNNVIHAVVVQSDASWRKHIPYAGATLPPPPTKSKVEGKAQISASAPVVVGQ